ncbi:MAG: hypothetical protein KF832_04990 [Caldilineaceae bacterium]|nr:hypothetical protein [Caldilineaceae bacterium]
MVQPHLACWGKSSCLRAWFIPHAVILLLLCLLVGTALPAQAAPGVSTPPVPAVNLLLPAQRQDPRLNTAVSRLSTPQLIEQAFRAGAITAAERILYLAYALYEPESLPAQFHSQVGWYGTQYVVEVENFYRNVIASTTDATQQELSRLSTLAATVCDMEDGASSFNSTNFHFNYDAISGGLGLTDYVTSMETTFGIEVTQYGWAEPPLCTGGDTCDGNDNPFDKYPVQILPLGNSLYGYVSGGGGGSYTGFIGDNPNTTAIETSALASCMVLNDDFSAFPEGAQAALDATTSHEFVHAIQNGYGDPDGREDSMWYESSAAYMEDEIFDDSNSNYYYLWPNIDNCLGEWPNNGDPGGISQYSNFLFFRHVAEHNGGTNTAGGGENIMQGFWENVASGQAGLVAYNNALGTAGTNLPDAFHTYAVAAKFSKSCSAGNFAPYCFEEGAAHINLAGSPPGTHGSITTNPGTYSGSIRDHYAAKWVSLPTTGSPYQVTLNNTAASGQLRGTLVCDRGTSMMLAPFANVVGAGSSTTIGAFDPTGCNSVVAVITNQQQTSGNPTSCSLHNYSLTVREVVQVNSSVSQTNMNASYNAAVQSCAANDTSSPIHTIAPTLRNNAATTFADLYFRVKQLEYVDDQDDKQPSLCNATTVVDGGRVHSILSVPNASLPGSDNQYNPNDELVTTFQVGLPVRARYRIFVDLYHTVATTAQNGSATDVETYLGSFTYEFDENGQLVTPQTKIFLPLVK